jgi:hypothetical protein
MAATIKPVIMGLRRMLLSASFRLYLNIFGSRSGLRRQWLAAIESMGSWIGCATGEKGLKYWRQTGFLTMLWSKEL